MIKNPLTEGGQVKPRVITAVREMVQRGYFKKSEAEKFEELKKLGGIVADEYGVENPIVRQGEVFGAFGCYQPATKTLTLSNTSIVTFLHEFRHHLQYSGCKRWVGYNTEQDAHGWSNRVYEKACPNMFIKAVKNGRIAALVWDTENEKVANNEAYGQIR